MCTIKNCSRVNKLLGGKTFSSYVLLWVWGRTYIIRVQKWVGGYIVMSFCGWEGQLTGIVIMSFFEWKGGLIVNVSISEWVGGLVVVIYVLLWARGRGLTVNISISGWVRELIIVMPNINHNVNVYFFPMGFHIYQKYVIKVNLITSNDNFWTFLFTFCQEEQFTTFFKATLKFENLIFQLILMIKWSIYTSGYLLYYV